MAVARVLLFTLFLFNTLLWACWELNSVLKWASSLGYKFYFPCTLFRLDIIYLHCYAGLCPSIILWLIIMVIGLACQKIP